MVIIVSFFQLAYEDLLQDVSLGNWSFSFGATALMTPWMRVVKSAVVGTIGFCASAILTDSAPLAGANTVDGCAGIGGCTTFGTDANAGSGTGGS